MEHPHEEQSSENGALSARYTFANSSAPTASRLSCKRALPTPDDDCHESERSHAPGEAALVPKRDTAGGKTTPTEVQQTPHTLFTPRTNSRTPRTNEQTDGTRRCRSETPYNGSNGREPLPHPRRAQQTQRRAPRTRTSEANVPGPASARSGRGGMHAGDIPGPSWVRPPHRVHGGQEQHDATPQQTRARTIETEELGVHGVPFPPKQDPRGHDTIAIQISTGWAIDLPASSTTERAPPQGAPQTRHAAVAAGANRRPPELDIHLARTDQRTATPLHGATGQPRLETLDTLRPAPGRFCFPTTPTLHSACTSSVIQAARPRCARPHPQPTAALRATSRLLGHPKVAVGFLNQQPGISAECTCPRPCFSLISDVGIKLPSSEATIRTISGPALGRFQPSVLFPPPLTPPHAPYGA